MCEDSNSLKIIQCVSVCVCSDHSTVTGIKNSSFFISFVCEESALINIRGIVFGEFCVCSCMCVCEHVCMSVHMREREREG